MFLLICYHNISKFLPVLKRNRTCIQKEKHLESVRQLTRGRCLLPSLMIRVQFSGPTRWKERINSHNIHIYIHTHSNKENVTNISTKCLIFLLFHDTILLIHKGNLHHCHRAMRSQRRCCDNFIFAALIQYPPELQTQFPPSSHNPLFPAQLVTRSLFPLPFDLPPEKQCYF